MYSQLIGLNGSTVEMCNSHGHRLRRARHDAPHPARPPRLADGAVHGRRGRRSRSTSRTGTTCIWDELEIYRRGVDERAAARRAARAPFDDGEQLDARVPDGVRDPARRGPAQRRRGEPARRVAARQRHRGRGARSRATTFGGQTFDKGSYVVWMTQAHRGLADTALGIGDDISALDQPALRAARRLEPRLPVGRRRRLDPARRRLRAEHEPRSRSRAHLLGGVEPGRGRRGYVLEIDSRDGGADAERARSTGGTPPSSRSTSFPARRRDAARPAASSSRPTRRRRSRSTRSARSNGIWFAPASATSLPALEPIDRAPRIAVLDRRGQPGRLVAPEPRLHGRPDLDGDDQHRRDRSARELRRDLQHRRPTRRRRTRPAARA